MAKNNDSLLENLLSSIEKQWVLEPPEDGWNRESLITLAAAAESVAVFMDLFPDKESVSNLPNDLAATYAHVEGRFTAIRHEMNQMHSQATHLLGQKVSDEWLDEDTDQAN